MASAAAAKKWPRLFQRWARSASDQPQVRLVDQGRGLERLPRLLLGQLLRGQLAQLVVDQRQQLLGRLADRPARWRSAMERRRTSMGKITGSPAARKHLDGGRGAAISHFLIAYLPSRRVHYPPVPAARGSPASPLTRTDLAMPSASIQCPSCRTMLRAPAHLAARRVHPLPPVRRRFPARGKDRPSTAPLGRLGAGGAVGSRPRDENRDQPVLRRWSEDEPAGAAATGASRAEPDQPRRSRKSVRKAQGKRSNAGLIRAWPSAAGPACSPSSSRSSSDLRHDGGRKDGPAVAAAPAVVNPSPAVNPPVVHPLPAANLPAARPTADCRRAAPSNPTPIVDPPPVVTHLHWPAPSGNGALADEVLRKSKKQPFISA